MMKKAARFILTFVFVAAMTCLVAGAAGEVYVSENGNDGNGGTNIADSVATLSRAYALLGDDGGTIYVLGAVTVGANSTNGQANVFLEPAHSGKIHITSAEANTPAVLKFETATHWYLSGETQIDNLQISLSANAVWAARHNHFTIGENVVMSNAEDYYIILLGGCNAGGETEHTAADTHLTLYSGTFGYIYGGSRNNVSESCCNGKTEIEVLGDIHTRIFSPGSVSTNVREALVTIDGSVTTESHFYFGGYNQTTGTVESVTFLLKSGSVDCGGVFPGGINRVQKVNVYYAEDASDLKTRFEEYLTAPLATYCAEVAGGHDYGANDYCTVCGAYAHVFDGGEITTPATCMEPGVKTYTCMDEGCEYLYTEPIAPLGHDLVEVEAEVAATCTTPGKTAQKRCQREGCDYSEGGETIAMLGHTWGEWVVTTPAQIGVAGEETRTCSVCHGTETRPIDPLPKEPETNNKNLIVLVTSANKKEYTVRFDTVGAAKIEPQTVKKNAVAAEPETPVKAGFYFTGWYRDARYETKYDFAQPVKEDITLYAKWSEVDPRIIMTVGSTDASVFGMATVTDVPPVIVNDRTMLPARFVAEALGATVTWNASERKVTILNGETGIELYIDSAAAYIDGRAVTLDSAPFIRDDRTYLPLRFIAEALGAKVDWMSETSTVVIQK